MSTIADTGINLDLSAEQRAIQETVRQFVDERVLPVAVENDIDHRLDMGIIEGMAELGILGAPIPAEYGGAALDFMSEALICEEIERGEAAFRTLISVHVGLNSLSLLKHGSEEQKQRWLVPQAKRREARLLRPDRAGGGLRRGGDEDDGGAPRRRLRPQRAEELDLLRRRSPTTRSCFAKTDPSRAATAASRRSWSSSRTRRACARADIPNKLGIWAGSTGEIFFDDAEVPAENVIGDGGRGLQGRDVLARPGPLHGGRRAPSASIRACLELSTRYAKERETFGQQIGRYQFVQDMIADMVLMYERPGCWCCRRRTTRQGARAGARTTRETSLAKVVATEYAFKAADLAVQIHGAYGYTPSTASSGTCATAARRASTRARRRSTSMMLAEDALGYRSLDG